MLSTGFVYLLISGLLQCLFVVDKCSVILFVLYIKFFMVYIAYQLISLISVSDFKLLHQVS